MARSILSVLIFILLPLVLLIGEDEKYVTLSQ